MSQENVNIVRGIYKSFARGDVPAVLEVLDPEVEWRLAENWIYADRNPLIGPQAIVEGTFTRLAAEWEEFSVIPEQLLSSGDHVIALGTYTGTYKSTGKQVHAQFAHIYTFARGKVRKLQQYTDTMQFAEVVKG